MSEPAEKKPHHWTTDALELRLRRWADWARCPTAGSDGEYHGYLRERTDHAHPPDPTIEIAVTDKAVASMMVERPDYWRAFKRFYLNPTELSVLEIGMQIGYHPDRVEAMLRQAKTLVGYKIKLREREGV